MPEGGIQSARGRDSKYQREGFKVTEGGILSAGSASGGRIIIDWDT